MIFVGLTQVGNDQIEAAIPTLEHGVALSNNESLNADMQRIIAEAKRFLAESAATAAQPDAQSARSKANQHVLLSGYTTQ